MAHHILSACREEAALTGPTHLRELPDNLSVFNAPRGFMTGEYEDERFLENAKLFRWCNPLQAGKNGNSGQG